MAEMVEVQAQYGAGKSGAVGSFFTAAQTCGPGSTKSISLSSTDWADVERFHKVAVCLECAAMASTTDEGKTLTVYLAGGISKTQFHLGGNSTPYQALASVSCRVAKGSATAQVQIVDVEGIKYMKPMKAKSDSVTSTVSWSMSYSRILG